MYFVVKMVIIVIYYTATTYLPQSSLFRANVHMNSIVWVITVFTKIKKLNTKTKTLYFMSLCIVSLLLLLLNLRAKPTTKQILSAHDLLKW